MPRPKRGTHGNGPGHHGPGGQRQHDPHPSAHRPHDLPYLDPNYDEPPDHGHEPPNNPRYPDERIYGAYASKRPPRYVPHPSCTRASSPAGRTISRPPPATTTETSIDASGRITAC
jgi:hypothetical protein